MTVTSTPALVHGVDVVAVDRVGDLLERFGSQLAQRVATPSEAGWAGDCPRRLSVLLAVKESAIKALGGRPEGFDWQCIEICRATQVAAPPAGAAALAAFDGHLSGPQDAECGLTGPGLQRARDRLAAMAATRVRGRARYGMLGDHVLATVTFWTEGSDD